MLDETPKGDGLEGAGPQKPASGDDAPLVAPEKPPYAHLELIDTLAGIASSNPKLFGTGVSASLAIGLLREAREELTALRHELTEVRAELAKTNIENAKLCERASSLGRLKTFRNISQTIGAALVGVSVKLLDGHETLGWSIGLLALVLIISSWFYEPKQTP